MFLSKSFPYFKRCFLENVQYCECFHYAVHSVFKRFVWWAQVIVETRIEIQELLDTFICSVCHVGATSSGQLIKILLKFALGTKQLMGFPSKLMVIRKEAIGCPNQIGLWKETIWGFAWSRCPGVWYVIWRWYIQPHIGGIKSIAVYIILEKLCPLKHNIQIPIL